MAISYLEFAERFSESKPSPVYLFAGEERYFIGEGVRSVRGRFLEEGTKDFNDDLCSAQDVEPRRVVEIAETLPVMAKCRVVVVKDIDKWNSKEKEAISAYLASPSPSTCLILTSAGLDRREKFSIAIEKKGIVILCQPLQKQDLTQWIKQRIRSAGKSIDQDALHMLTETAGNDLGTLYNDIEKLSLFCEGRKQITLKDVAMVSSGMRSVSVFEVVNALFDRRLKDAFFSLKRALDDGEPPVRVFYFIVRELRLLLKGKLLIEGGKRPEEAAKSLGIPPFRTKEFSRRLGKFSRQELYALYEELLDADLRLKGGAPGPEGVLEGLFLRIDRSGGK